MTPGISVIIPVLNEEQGIARVLQALQVLRQAGHEVLVVDGGSDDRTCERSMALVDRLLHSPRGRARQLQLGALEARGKLLWFVHGDTLVSEAAVARIQVIAASSDPVWGRFAARLSGPGWRFRTIERLMNMRSRITGIATGDQALFMDRSLFLAVQGWPQFPLMEDVAMCDRLKRIQLPLCLCEVVETSSRRWERHGIVRTILLMWGLRLAFSLGVDPARLVAFYTRPG